MIPYCHSSPIFRVLSKSVQVWGIIAKKPMACKNDCNIRLYEPIIQFNKFNSAKSRVACFGLGNNYFCDIYLTGSAVAMVNKVKYLGVYFECKSGLCDISRAIRFYSQFNNIMAVIGKNSNELSTMHLVKTYCLCTLLFACEIWNMSDQSMHKLNVAWNNCFRYIFREFWRESVKSL